MARPQSWAYRSSKFFQRNKAGTAIAALLVITLVLGSWSVVSQLQLSVAQSEAKADKIRANQRQTQFDQLNNFLFHDLHEIVAKLPDSLEIRELIMHQAIKVIEELETGDVFSTEDALSLSQAYAKLSEVQSGIRNPEFGDKEKSIQSLDRAEELCDQVLAARPNDLTAIRLQASLLRHRGDVAKSLKQFDETFKQYKAALDVADVLYTSDPTDVSNRRLYANALLDVGGAFAKLEDDAKAEEYYKRTLEIRKQTLQSHPLDVGVRRDYSVALNRLGGIAARKNDFEKALEFFKDSLHYREQLLHENPLANREARDVANQHRLLASIYNNLDKSKEFLFHYQEYVNITADLSAMSPQDARAQTDMRTARNAIAGIYSVTGDEEKASYDFWLYEQLIRRQLERTPENETYQYALVKNYLELAKLQTDLGRAEDAKTTLQKAQAFCNQHSSEELTEICQQVADQLHELIP